MALLAAITLNPGALVAKDKAEKGSIRYTFSTLLVPDEVKVRSGEVMEKEAWLLAGKAVPARAVSLSEDVIIPNKKITLPKGTVLSVANSPYFVACSETHRVSVNFGMGILPICLIDMDRDGSLDAWYKSSVDIIWNEYAGHIQRDDIYPIQPVNVTHLSPSDLRALEAWGAFRIRYIHGHVTFCLGIGDMCSTGGTKVKLSNVDQTVEFMGGAFALRLTGDPKRKMIAYTILRDPNPLVF